MSNGAADRAFANRLAQLEAFARLPVSARPAVARAVARVQLATIAAGTDPNGVAWAPTKEGKRPLENAAAAVTVDEVSGGVVIRVSGPEKLHHTGEARGHTRRQIIPSGAIPARMSAAIGDAVDVDFAKIAAGGSS